MSARNICRLLRPKLSALSGYLFLWIAVGNAFGWIAHWIAVYFFDLPESSFIVDVLIYIPEESANRPAFPEPERYYCYPQPVMRGFYYHCETVASSLFWFFTVGIPGTCWSFVATGFGLLKGSIIHMGSTRRLLEGLLWLLISTPILSTIFFGILYWKQRNMTVYFILAAPFILYLIWGAWVF